jgi:hypothetical protein
MTLRVPTPAIQGPQQLGVVQAQASDTPFQNLRLPDTAFNSRLLEQLGGDAVRLGEYLQEQEDERLLLEFQAELGDWERQTLYGEMPDGTGAPEGGVLALEGPDAFGLAERMQQDFDARLSEFNETLGGLSANGRLAAQEYAQSRRAQLLDRATRIEFEQRDRYNRQLRAQAAAAAARAAEVAWASPEEMAAAEANLRSAVTNRATAEYADVPDASIRNEMIRSEVSRELEEFQRTAVLRAIGSGDNAAGQRIYQEGIERGTIQLRDDDPLTRVVRFSDQATVIVNSATMAYEAYPDDRNAAIEMLRGMGLDGDTERDAVSELEGRFSAAARVEADELDDLIERARVAAANRDLWGTFNTVELSRIPQATIDQLNYINQGGGLVSNPELFDRLSSRPPRELIATDLTVYMGQLSSGDYTALRNAQDTARRAFADAAQDAADQQQALLQAADSTTVQQLLSGEFERYRIDDNSPESANMRAYIRRTFDAWQRRFVQENERSPNNSERYDFLDALMVTSTSEAMLAQRRADITQEQVQVADVQTVPQVIETELRARGINPRATRGSDARQYQFTVTAVEAWRRDFVTRNAGREPSNAELRAFINTLVSDVPTGTNFFTGDPAGFDSLIEAVRGTRAEAQFPGVPELTLVEIGTALADLNRPVSEESVGEQLSYLQGLYALGRRDILPQDIAQISQALTDAGLLVTPEAIQTAYDAARSQ